MPTQRAAGARRQTPDRVVWQPVFGGEYPFRPAFKPVQPVVGANPYSPRGVFQQDVHVRFPTTCKDGGASAPIEPRKASVGPDPQHAPRIHHQRTDRGAGQAQVTRNLFKAAIRVTQQPVTHCADPQRSIRRRQQRGDYCLVHERSIRAIEYREIHAIEASHSAGGRKPKIPVGGLRDRADRVLRQPVRCRPDIVTELSESQPGIQSPARIDTSDIITNRLAGPELTILFIGQFERAMKRMPPVKLLALA